MNGLEAARRAPQLGPTCRVLFHRSYDDPIVHAEAVAAGGASYVVKGQPVQLWAALRAVAETRIPCTGEQADPGVRRGTSARIPTGGKVPRIVADS